MQWINEYMECIYKRKKKKTQLTQTLTTYLCIIIDVLKDIIVAEEEEVRLDELYHLLLVVLPLLVLNGVLCGEREKKKNGITSRMENPRFFEGSLIAKGQVFALPIKIKCLQFIFGCIRPRPH